MKHYTETIPLELAKKLKEKGMPIEMQPLYAPEAPNARGIVKAGVGLWCPPYAEVFDWLMEKGVFIFGFRRFDNWRWAYSSEWRFRIELEDISQESVNGYLVNGYTRHEAATKAIEKALEFIKED